MQDWFRLFGIVAETNLAAQRVIALRMLRLARGGQVSQREARRMVVEKIAAAVQTNLMLAGGANLDRVAKHYRSAVRANERRLTRK